MFLGLFVLYFLLSFSPSPHAVWFISSVCTWRCKGLPWQTHMFPLKSFKRRSNVSSYAPLLNPFLLPILLQGKVRGERVALGSRLPAAGSNHESPFWHSMWAETRTHRNYGEELMPWQIFCSFLRPCEILVVFYVWCTLSHCRSGMGMSQHTETFRALKRNFLCFSS